MILDGIKFATKVQVLSPPLHLSPPQKNILSYPKKVCFVFHLFSYHYTATEKR